MMPEPAAATLQLLEGTIERVTYQSEDTGYAVARLALDGNRGLATVVGALQGLWVGESLKIWGHWLDHPRYGRQLAVERYEERLPATVEGIRRYLGSRLIRGVGPVTAKRIVDHFGLATLEIIDKEPGRLAEVPGVGPARVAKLAAAWEEQRHIQRIMIRLQGHGLSTGLAMKIHKRYGADAVAVVEKEPYRLARDIRGVGFLTADRIARRTGVAADSPARLEAGLLHALGRFADEGHTFAPRPELLAAAAGLLRVPGPAIDECVDALVAAETVRTSPVTEAAGAVEAIYLPAYYFAELGVAGRLRAMLQQRRSRLEDFEKANWRPLLAEIDRCLPYTLADAQREAVALALTCKVAVLTGGPGTGKTSTLRAVLQLLRSYGHSVALAAPTGRAAKRLGEATGMEAKTLHRLLEFRPSDFRFQRDRDHPLSADMVIVDEASMVDLLLMNALTQALRPDSHLLLVGDVDQLPAVGAGNVLRDLIASSVVPTVRLQRIFRQPAGSYIVENAHRINQGERPRFEKDATDFFLFPVEDAEAAVARLVDVVANRIPARFGLDAVDDVQVLSPMHRGLAGVSALNERLQEALNPPAPSKAEVRLGGRLFRVADKVMQVRNNYARDIYNGDLGRIVDIDLEDQTIHVTFDVGQLELDYGEMEDIVHAFAISTHKSQGGEYPAVVLALLPAHHLLLQRNLLYTAITRARRLCVIVGSRRAIATAVRNDKIAARHTALAQRLREP